MSKKHAFLIQAHNHPGLLEEILDRLNFQDIFFYISIDKKSKAYNESVLDSLRNKYSQIRYIGKDINVCHGGFSQIMATLNLLEVAYNDSDLNLEYFHLISGQDYPLVNENEFRFFFNDNEKSYMQYDTRDEIIDWRKNKYIHRTQLFHFTDYIYTNLLSPKANYYLSRVLTKAFRVLPYKRRKIDEICGGWSWFSWHRKVVTYVLGYIYNNPEYLNRFKMTYCCDELIFHTLLDSKCEEFSIERNNSLRFIVWNPRRYSKYLPLVLDEREFDEILASEAFFARKIDPILSRGLINSINKKIGR